MCEEGVLLVTSWPSGGCHGAGAKVMVVCVRWRRMGGDGVEEEEEEEEEVGGEACCCSICRSRDDASWKEGREKGVSFAYTDTHTDTHTHTHTHTHLHKSSPPNASHSWSVHSLHHPQHSHVISVLTTPLS